jgi:hypothetical protein
MTFNVCLTTIAGVGQQSSIAFEVPAMIGAIFLTLFTACQW